MRLLRRAARRRSGPPGPATVRCCRHGHTQAPPRPLGEGAVAPPPQGPPPLHVVLVNPQIPNNTGAAGRTCLGFGAVLHLIEPLGFEMSDKRV